MNKNLLLSVLSLLLFAVMPAKAQNTITPGDYIINGDFIDYGGVDDFFKPLIGNNKTTECKIDDTLDPEGRPVLCMAITTGMFKIFINFTPYPIVDDKVAYSSEQYISSPMPAVSTSKYSICGADGSTDGVVTLSKVDKVLDTWNVSDYGLMSNGVMKVLIKNAKLIKDQKAPNKEGVEVQISKAGVGTFCPVYGNVSIPEGVKVHIIQDGSIKEGTKDGTECYYVRTEEVDASSIIGYAEGVIVEGTANSTVLFPYSDEPYTELPDNCLIGATTDVTAYGPQYAFTAKLEDGVYIPVLRHVKAGTVIPQGKAYYVPKTGSAVAEYVNIIIGDEATAIMTVQSDNAEMNNVTYSISGQKVGADYKGIVIRNGKKTLVK